MASGEKEFDTREVELARAMRNNERARGCRDMDVNAMTLDFTLSKMGGK